MYFIVAGPEKGEEMEFYSIKDKKEFIDMINSLRKDKNFVIWFLAMGTEFDITYDENTDRYGVERQYRKFRKYFKSKDFH